jgi:hypothetical protein
MGSPWFEETEGIFQRFQIQAIARYMDSKKFRTMEKLYLKRAIGKIQVIDWFRFGAKKADYAETEQIWLVILRNQAKKFTLLFRYPMEMKLLCSAFLILFRANSRSISFLSGSRLEVFRYF